MRKPTTYAFLVCGIVVCAVLRMRGGQKALKPEFHTSDRCFACHNELRTQSGRDISIGLAWRSSMMANSARDPYWQASVRRESMDHPEAGKEIEDECSICHMPIVHYEAKLRGQKAEVFKQLPFDSDNKESGMAADGVTCSVCHQINEEKLGTRESFNGGFVIEPPRTKNDRPEYGPFEITSDLQHIMDTSTGGFQPTYALHIRDSAMCGSCHQLYTTARDAGGKEIGYLPEQMPYLEWKHSDYPNKYSCQGCHMPEVNEAVNISSVLGVPRSGMHQHVFVGGNFLLQGMLNRYRDELQVEALPQELTSAVEGTLAFLQSQSAQLEIRHVELEESRLRMEVAVHNLSGHKLPTAYPSRRAWLHVTVRDRDGNVSFESGKLNADGSIAGNDNDADPLRYEPHYREITSGDQVQIFESILGDPAGHVTTGLIAATQYLKDNRVLPTGFDKGTAEKDIAVIGDAANDPSFAAGGDSVRYSVPVSEQGPFRIEVELLYQPVGFRWAHNLEFYKAMEAQRFVRYYDFMSSQSSTVLAKAEVVR
jgi:hypothetical protein